MSSGAKSNDSNLTLDDVFKFLDDPENLAGDDDFTELRPGLQADSQPIHACAWTVDKEIVPKDLMSFWEYKRSFVITPPDAPSVFAESCQPHEVGFTRPDRTLDATGAEIKSSEFQYAIAIKAKVPNSSAFAPIAVEEIWLVRNSENEKIGRPIAFISWVIDPNSSVPDWVLQLRATASNRIFVKRVNRVISHKSYASLSQGSSSKSSSKLDGSLSNGFGSTSTSDRTSQSFGSGHTPFTPFPNGKGVNQQIVNPQFSNDSTVDTGGGYFGCAPQLTPSSGFVPSSSNGQSPSPALSGFGFGSQGSSYAFSGNFGLGSQDSILQPNPANLPVNALSNNLVPDLDSPEILFAGCESVKDCTDRLNGAKKSNFSDHSERPQNHSSENSHHNPFHKGMSERPRSCWCDPNTKVWWSIINDSNSKGDKVQIVPAVNYSLEENFTAMLIPKSEAVSFGVPVELKVIGLPVAYLPRGSLFGYLSRADLVKIFNSSEDSSTWGKVFFFLEEILPRPPRSGAEFQQMSFEGQIAEPWLATVLSCNQFPIEFLTKLKNLLAFFTERVKKAPASEYSDDDRFIEYSLRRCELARTHLGASSDNWIDSSKWKKYASCAQARHHQLSTKMLLECFPSLYKETQATEMCHVVAFLLGLAPWSRTETISRAVRQASVPPHGPMNALHAFNDTLVLFLDLNPSLDSSALPSNSKGRPLALDISRMRPDAPVCTTLDFAAFCNAQMRPSSAFIKAVYNDKQAHNNQQKKNNRNRKKGQQQQAESNSDVVAVEPVQASTPSVAMDTSSENYEHETVVPKVTKQPMKKKKPNGKKADPKKKAAQAKKQ